MRGKARRHLVWALLFGLVTAVLLWTYVRSVKDAAVRNQPVPVVVAAKVIEPGTTITSDMVKTVQWPQAITYQGLLQSPTEAVGQQTKVALEPGQPVLSREIAPLEAVGHGGNVPLGKRLISILVDEESTIGYRVRSGDRVDLLAVYNNEKGTHAELALQAIPVYAVGREGGDGKVADPKTITLMVTPEEALQISVIAEQKSVRLVLRPTGDRQINQPPPVTRPSVK